MSDKTPREWALQLPPDVLEHPMPSPYRLDYAEAIIRRAQNQATAALRSQRDELAAEAADWKALASDNLVKRIQQQDVIKELAGATEGLLLLVSRLTPLADMEEFLSVKIARAALAKLEDKR